MSNTKGAEAVDGRRLRSERSRLAIIEAVLALQEEGVLVPTAQQISDRAGVGIRSFFRHFEDMEALFEAADDHIRDSYEALFLGGDRDGTLEERIASVILSWVPMHCSGVTIYCVRITPATNVRCAGIWMTGCRNSNLCPAILVNPSMP